MTFRKLLGGTLIASPFVGVAVGGYFMMGLIPIILVYVASAIVIGVIWLGGYLLDPNTEKKKNENAS